MCWRELRSWFVEPLYKKMKHPQISIYIKVFICQYNCGIYSFSSIYLNGQNSSNTLQLCCFQSSKIECLSARVQEVPLHAQSLAGYCAWKKKKKKIQILFLQRLTSIPQNKNLSLFWLFLHGCLPSCFQFGMAVLHFLLKLVCLDPFWWLWAASSLYLTLKPIYIYMSFSD